MDFSHGIRAALTALGGVVPSMVILGLSLGALAVRRAWWPAAWLVAALILAIGISVATKVAFYAWDIRFGLAVFRGASGHALRATAMYPSFAWIVFAGSSRRRSAVALAAGILVALAVTLSTIEPAMHTSVEAFAGALIGAGVPMAIGRAGRLTALPTRLQLSLVACAIASCAFLPATDYDFEQRVVDFSGYLND